MHRIASSIEINAPIEKCFQVWSDFERFPEFIENVKSVRKNGKYWHWIVQGPFHETVEWDAEVDLRYENMAIIWSTPPESKIASSGTVNFTEPGPNRTLVEVVMTYSPPAGPFGELIADVTHYPDYMVDKALTSFKTRVEGKTTERTGMYY